MKIFTQLVNGSVTGGLDINMSTYMFNSFFNPTFWLKNKEQRTLTMMMCFGINVYTIGSYNSVK
jgi:hypothetical protein